VLQGTQGSLVLLLQKHLWRMQRLSLAALTVLELQVQ
jgi:hypothetical protein